LEKIRLYIDEDLSDRVAVALRSKGFDAISAHEVNMRSKTDKEQLDYSYYSFSLVNGNNDSEGISCRLCLPFFILISSQTSDPLLA
jgi:predicted nuclease of predicted toxin-antitoxin system